jgi:hypothetical protein
VCGVPGWDAASIAESEGVSPRSPGWSADARSGGHVPVPGVLATTGKRPVAPEGSFPVRPTTAAVTAPRG